MPEAERRPYAPSSLLPTQCVRCGERFLSYKVREPGARPGTERWGPGRRECGVCRPIMPEIPWEFVPANRLPPPQEEE